MASIPLAISQLQQAFSKWNDGQRIAGAPAIDELAKITAQCVEGLEGDRRILAYALNRVLFAILNYWEGAIVIDLRSFLQHAHQPIAVAISLLQDSGSAFDDIRPTMHKLIDAQKQVVA